MLLSRTIILFLLLATSYDKYILKLIYTYTSIIYNSFQLIVHSKPRDFLHNTNVNTTLQGSCALDYMVIPLDLVIGFNIFTKKWEKVVEAHCLVNLIFCTIGQPYNAFPN